MTGSQELLQSYYIRLPGGALCQGDIWAGLPSPFLNGQPGLGVLVTPRCDLAHDKAHFVNYLPLVPFQDYLCAEGGFELLDQELSNARDRTLVVGRELGIDRLLAAGVGLSEAVTVAQRVVDPSQWRTPRIQGLVSELHKKAEQTQAISKALSKDRLDSEIIRAFISARMLTKYKKQIARNAVADLHFLPPCQPLFHTPVVVMLRCVGTCAANGIKMALSCLTQQDWERALEREPAIPGIRVHEKPERLARLKSPYLEALMARFGALFTRVGTRDIPDEAIAQMIDKED